MARFYGTRAEETGQNVNEGTRIVNELPRLNRPLPECIEIYPYTVYMCPDRVP